MDLKVVPQKNYFLGMTPHYPKRHAFRLNCPHCDCQFWSLSKDVFRLQAKNGTCFARHCPVCKETFMAKLMDCEDCNYRIDCIVLQISHPFSFRK